MSVHGIFSQVLLQFVSTLFLVFPCLSSKGCFYVDDAFQQLSIFRVYFLGLLPPSRRRCKLHTLVSTLALIAIECLRFNGNYKERYTKSMLAQVGTRVGELYLRGIVACVAVDPSLAVFVSPHRFPF